MRLISISMIILSTLVGAAMGLGLFTFHYGQGLSYLSSDPEACINCHIMNQQFKSWQGSGHHHVATCVQCHLPEKGLAKYIAKAENGWHHSFAFTTGRFAEPIQISQKNLRILENNCRSCHQSLVNGSVVHSSELYNKNEMSCIHCHRNVGHLPIQ